MAGRGGRAARGIIAGPFLYPGRGQDINQEGVPLPPVPIQAEDEELIYTEVSTLLSSIGFTSAICNRITITELIIITQDFLALHKDTIDRVFTRFDHANIPYTTS